MNFSTLTKYIDSLEKCGIPGCEMHITLEGKPVYSYAAGFSNSEGTRKADFCDTYRLFSCTKLLTVTCAMRLVEEGRLALDDTVSQYLPEYEHLTVMTGEGVRPAKNPLTIRHLLTMTGGLSYNVTHQPIRDAAADGTASTRQMVASFAKVPLLFDPGESYEYSLCHDVLGAVIEVITGERLGEYMSKVIFEPLGMTSITLNEQNRDMSLVPDMYYYDRGLYRARVDKDFRYDTQLTPCYESGGGGGICTGTDYAKFAAALSNGGVSAEGYRLLTEASLDLMKTDGLNEAQRSRFIQTVGKPGYSYGHGVRTLISKEIGQSLSPLGEFGWDGMGGCYTMIDTQNKIGIFFGMQVVGCNYCYSNVHPMLRNLTYMALEK